MDREYILQKYSTNELNEQEKALFDEWYASDPAFRDEADEAQRLRNAILADRKEKLKQVFQSIEQDYHRKRLSVWRYAIVASVLLMLGFVLYLTMVSPPLSDEQLYAQHFEPYKNVLHPLERGETNLSSEAIAFQNYEHGKYDIASRQFDSLYTATETPYLLFYQGVSAMELGDFQQAESLLLAHQFAKDDFYHQNQWYLALLYIKQGEKQKAKPLLEQVAQSKFNAERAKELLKNL